MHIFITGVSKGFGKALAEHFLAVGNKVTGIGRHHSFDHENFSFIHCDLRKIEEVRKVSFDTTEEEILLINNAGVIGNIQRISDQEIPDILEVMTVNSLAPMYLCHQFLRQTSEISKITIINISSGAANRAIPAWAAYCSSKIAMDRFSETIYLEELEKKRNIRVLSVAPGVLDTEMQVKIRSAKSDDFSSLLNFQELKEKGELTSVKEAVNKLVKLIAKEFDGKVICSLRDLD